MTTGDYETFRQVRLVPDQYFDAFVVRLARENLWTRPHAERVVEEYRRFLFLALTVVGPVTPSDAVDQVWHLHLTDTVSYRRFCDQAFGAWLDHVPSRGGPVQAGLMQEQYFRTLSVYKSRFGSAPPEDIWPDLSTRFGHDLTHVRLAMADHIVLRLPKVPYSERLRAIVAWFRRPGVATIWLALLIALLTDWMPGPLFLFVDVTLWIICITQIQSRLRRHGVGPHPKLDVYQVAELAAPGRSVDVAMAGLLDRGLLHFDESDKTLSRKGEVPSDTPPLELEIWSFLPEEGVIGVRDLEAKLRRLPVSVSSSLRDAGLTEAQVPEWPFAFLAPLVGLLGLVLRFGTARPPGLLIVLLVLQFWISVFCFSRRVRRTPLGNAVLAALLSEHQNEDRAFGANERVGLSNSHSTVQMAIALFGIQLAALPHLALDAWTMTRPSTAAMAANGGGCSPTFGGGGGDGGGSDGCGGGCGGCGG